MRLFPSRAVGPVFALALAALGACTDRPDPTQVPAQLEPNALINGDGGGGDEPDPLTPYISSLSVNNTTLTIGGSSSASYTAMLRNPGWTLDPVVMAGFIRQGTTTRAAGARAVHCGDAPSVLPNGFCTDGGLLSATNTASGTGTLVPGPASFQVQLKVGTTVVATRSVAVTLVYPTPTITAVSLPSASILLPRASSIGPYSGEDASAPRYTFTVYNPGPSIPNVEVEGIVRDADLKFLDNASTGQVWCDAAQQPVNYTGTLPTGTCTISAEFNPIRAFTSSPAGNFVVQLRLWHGVKDASWSTVITTSAPAPLVLAKGPAITATAVGVEPNVRDIKPRGDQGEFPPDTLTLGDTLTFTVFIDNPVPIQRDVIVRVSLVESMQFHLHHMGRVRLNGLPSGRSTVSIPVSVVLDPAAPGPIRLERVKLLHFNVIDSEGPYVGTGMARRVQLVSP